MTPNERIEWCIANAVEIEATLPPQKDPHLWDMPRLCAVMWRDMAERVRASAREAGL